MDQGGSNSFKESNSWIISQWWAHKDKIIFLAASIYLLKCIFDIGRIFGGGIYTLYIFLGG